MNYIYFIIPAIFLLFILILTVIFHLKKKDAIKKVNSLGRAKKSAVINTLVEPVGYMYDPCQDIFVSRLDAPQKIFGYTTLYDLSASYFNMIFDYETIYFDYKERTWLIEMWKGQYGINTGCELGVYYADKIIPPEKYNTTIFKAVEPEDMPDISLKLNRYCPNHECKYTQFGHMHKKHWWLTIFKMGAFSKPEELFVNTSITFKDYPMMYSFLDSFKKAMPYTTYKTSRLTVYFNFYDSKRKYTLFKKFARGISLAACKIYCKWFNHLTRPFSKSCDKLLYIYYYLPFVIRILFRPKKYHTDT